MQFSERLSVIEMESSLVVRRRRPRNDSGRVISTEELVAEMVSKKGAAPGIVC